MKPFLVWARLSDEIMVIQGGGIQLYLQGESVTPLARLLPQLDGSPLPEAASAAGVAEAEAAELIDTLSKRRVLDDLAEDSPGPDSRLSDALSPFTSTPRAAAKRLAASCAVVEGEGTAADTTLALLRECGVGEAARQTALSRAGFIIFAEDAPSSDAWRKIHRSAKGRPWVRVAVDGARAWVGPTHSEGHSCVACFEERVKGMLSRPEAEPVRVRKLAPRGPRPSALPTLVHEAAALAVEDAVFVLSGARSAALEDRAAEVIVGAGTRIHPVLPVPGCETCGGPRS